MPIDLQAWLKEIAADGSLSESEISTLLPILGKEKTLNRLSDQVLMRGDYTRKTQELADERRRLNSEISTQRDELETWRSGVQTQLDKAYGDLQTARTTQAQFEARVRTIAERNNLDPRELLAGSDQARREVDATTREEGKAAGLSEADLDRLLDTRIQSYLGNSRVIAGAIDAEISDIADEHRELFGTRLKRTELYQKAVALNMERQKSKQPLLSVRDIWEAENKVPEKRKELERSAMRAELQKEVETENRAKLSESLLDSGNHRASGLTDQHSPVFQRERKLHADGREHKADTSNGSDKSQQDKTVETRTAAEGEGRWQKAAMSFRDRRAQGVPLGEKAPTGDKAHSEA